MLVQENDRQLIIEISDDGAGGTRQAGSGISGLRDRVLALGGTLVIESPRGHGTHVIATLPIDTSVEAAAT